jgi:integrase
MTDSLGALASGGSPRRRTRQRKRNRYARNESGNIQWVWSIRQLAEILDAYRSSMGSPQSGVMFRSGAGQHMDFDKLARRVRPVVEILTIDWYGWRGFRRGIASNLYEMGADEKIVQRILRHAKSHVTKDRYIKAFDPAVVAAMKKLEATVDLVNQSAARVHQIS